MSDRVAEIMAQWQRERPDLDVRPQAVFGRLHRLADRLRSELVRGYGDFGLGEGEFDVLATLRRQGAPYELAPGEIARQTMVTTGAVSKRLDRLESDGLVERAASEDDGRGRVVRLTGAGRRVIDDAFSAHIARERRLLEPLTEDQAEQLATLLQTWLQGVTDQATPAAPPGP